MKEKIEKFKDERIGAKRKDFVETVQTEAPRGDELEMKETGDGVEKEDIDQMDTTEG